MKLLNCHVSSFGKLKDFDYDFNQKINTFNKENGWGKSTFATFIKAMFYGLNDSKTKSNVAENERTKYKPWNSVERFGGYLTFERGGNNYKIERFFGNKSSEDTVKLIDLSTGKEFANSENLGKRIFEVDEEGFLSTTYFSQKDFQIKSNTSLTEKYNQVCEFDSNSSFDSALKKVEEKRKEYKPYRGNGGKLNETKDEIYYLAERIEQSEEAQGLVLRRKADLKEIEEKINEKKAQIKQIEKQIEVASNLKALNEKKKQLNSYIEDKEKAQKSIEYLEQFLNGNKVDEEEKKYFNRLNSEIDADKMVLQSLENDLSTLENGQENKRKDNRYLILLLTAVLFAIGGGVLLFFNKIVAIVLFVVCAILIGVGLYFFSLSKKNTAKNEQNFKLIQDKREKYAEKELEIEKKQKELFSYLNKFVYPQKMDVLNSLEFISRLKTKYDLEKVNLEVIQSKIDNLDLPNDLNEGYGCDKSLEQLNEENKQLGEDYRLLVKEQSDINSTINKHQADADSIIDLKTEWGILLDKQKEENYRYKILTKTFEFLQHANERLKTKYRAPLQESLDKYLSLLTKNSKAIIDVDLVVRGIENDGEKDIEYYSKGYKNLFEICKRFALTDVLFTKEKPFIILDDPFYNLDGEKISQSLKLIKELSNEYQIIYFTCHDSRTAQNV